MTRIGLFFELNSMAKKTSKSTPLKDVVTLTHAEASRRNIPTAEYESVMAREQQVPKQVRYPRNADLDPQLVWRGKDEQDWSDLVVHAPPLYIQEKVHPKALIDDLRHQSDVGRERPEARVRCRRRHRAAARSLRGLQRHARKATDKTEFYAARSELVEPHDPGRFIAGDGEPRRARGPARQGAVHLLRSAVRHQIQFSNFQWSDDQPRRGRTATSGHITREPEQVKAFRDTWRDGIHSVT